MKKTLFLLLALNCTVSSFAREPLQFTSFSSPILEALSGELTKEEVLSKETQDLIDSMLQIARGEREDFNRGIMVGLAAPQLGILKRIILVDIGLDMSKKQLGKLTAFINPKIIWRSSESNIEHEGCYSVPEGLIGMVPRPLHIKFTALDREGNSVEQELSGLSARVFQHELDHLEGIRFPERVGENGVLHWVFDHDIVEYRKNRENWPNICSWGDWLKIKEQIAPRR
ncbi:MAG: peptide deformylase [Chlamydiae bacterium]|nr:peptide deformylase [Chlamydiota bacterium]